MDYEELKREYEYCNQYPSVFSINCGKVKNDIELMIRKLNFFQMGQKKELQQQLLHVEHMYDYKEKFNNEVKRLKENYLAEGYLVESVKWLMEDIERKILAKNIQSMPSPGVLSLFLTCEEDYVIIESANNSKDQKGSGALGDLRFGGAILYEGSVSQGLICSEMAYMHSIAELINGQKMPINGMKYYACVVTYDIDKKKNASRVWVTSSSY